MIEPRRASTVFRAGATLALLFFSGLVHPADPDPEAVAAPQPEYRVKAKILRSFASYVEWPETAFDGPDAPFTVCIFGADPFGAEIDEAMAGRLNGERPMEVRRLRYLEEAQGCQIVFVSRAERHRQAAILAGLAGRPILTVGESDWFIQDGGGIRLAIGRNKDGKTKARFEVNLKALHEVGLEARSRLLILAARIYR